MEVFLQEEDSSQCLNFGLVDTDAADSKMMEKILVNEGDYVGRRLSTNTRVPGNPHKREFREFWE